MNEAEIYTVTQLNRYLKHLVDSDPPLKNLCIKGEVSNFTNHLKTGHYYFTLKDQTASIRVVMFAPHAKNVTFQIENGLRAILTGAVQLFGRDGTCQFYCSDLQPDGIGALHLAFEQLKQSLAQQGLFAPEHKKPIPAFPKRIGVITSKTGAAYQDILNILTRRCPLVTVVLIPCLVQGKDAPASICGAIHAAQTLPDLDLLLVGRGGGSIEDLWAFNDQAVAHAIYDCTIPIISAVGHEIDFTIADFTADLRAPTPSAAAELAVPDLQDLHRQLVDCYQKMTRATIGRFQKDYTRLKTLYAHLQAVSPKNRLAHSFDSLCAVKQRLDRSMEARLLQDTRRFQKNVQMLQALSPLQVLTRGYSITTHLDRVITSRDQVHTGDLLTTRLSDSTIQSKVIELAERSTL